MKVWFSVFACYWKCRTLGTSLSEECMHVHVQDMEQLHAHDCHRNVTEK